MSYKPPTSSGIHLISTSYPLTSFATNFCSLASSYDQYSSFNTWSLLYLPVSKRWLDNSDLWLSDFKPRSPPSLSCPCVRHGDWSISVSMGSTSSASFPHSCLHCWSSKTPETGTSLSFFFSTCFSRKLSSRLRKPAHVHSGPAILCWSPYLVPALVPAEHTLFASQPWLLQGGHTGWRDLGLHFSFLWAVVPIFPLKKWNHDQKDNFFRASW